MIAANYGFTTLHCSSISSHNSSNDDYNPTSFDQTVNLFCTTSFVAVSVVQMFPSSSTQEVCSVVPKTPFCTCRIGDFGSHTHDQCKPGRISGLMPEPVQSWFDSKKELFQKARQPLKSHTNCKMLFQHSLYKPLNIYVLY